MLDNPVFWIVLSAAVVLVVVLVVVLRRDTTLEAIGIRRRPRPHRDDFRPEGTLGSATPLKRAGVIVNPTKFSDLPAVRQRITAACGAHGWGEPIWYETTEADPGTGQARRAAAEGAAVVCPLGGDGTVRAVAAALVGTETPLGLLPAGTGNLLARNLDLPVDSIERALGVALTGQNVRIDVGRLAVDPSGQHADPDQHIFLVMAGVGFDAAIMAGAPEALKARVGSAAYLVSGMRNMLGPQFRVRLSVDGETELSRRTRTVIIGNVGKLFGGLVLMPGARFDDGLLDTVVLSPRGVVGWTALAGHVVTRQRRGHPLLDRHVGEEVRITTDRPQEVQLDGDPIGRARSITATVDHLALVVRVGPTAAAAVTAPGQASGAPPQ
ncbi:MAG: diacylglycerol kinase family lipid kinase [Actinomycetota bacterium]|nr:diacylglycerol kinase family lipid kinase [Actinomycetota bacterium]